MVKLRASLRTSHALDLLVHSFAVTGSQFGVVLVPDEARALREIVRVTRPAGACSPRHVTAVLNLTEEQQATLRQILDGMLRERAGRPPRRRIGRTGLLPPIAARCARAVGAGRRHAATIRDVAGR